ncbi:hypothetical protein CBW46_007575 [Paenibacillus xerothermodurans]|uniref:Uncharacterized protein n=1 Tax=Paenibacillus xerothermodurans TaxID=1977292 RepID=A0A2W1NBE8_PAEXE|nr:hypothetical protein CBW46_007575 [Paenibacillus xerothermodurans]
MTDVVVLRLRRNAAHRKIISAFRAIGSTAPCQHALGLGKPLLPAVRCLTNSGFRVAFAERDVLVFIRRR